MAMGDFSILGGTYTRQHDRYGNLLSRAKPVEEAAPISEELPTPEEAPATPTVELSPYAGFGGVISALGMDTFMPPGTSAADTINESLQLAAPFILNPELAAQLIGNQTTEPPAEEAVAGALNALDTHYDINDPVTFFKQLDVHHAGQLSPWDLTSAVTRAGGSYEQASALVKQLDPFNTGSISIQQVMANLPAASDAEPAQPVTPEPAPFDDSAIGGLGALAKTYDLGQPLDMFAQLDADFDGLVTEADVVNAVLANGGSAEAGSALYAQIDPARSGAVAQGQFLANLYPRIDLPNFLV